MSQLGRAWQGGAKMMAGAPVDVERLGDGGRESGESSVMRLEKAIVMETKPRV